MNGGVNPSYQWKKNGVNVGSNSSSFTTSDLVNGDHINCFVTSDINCPATNPVSSNTLTVSILPNYPVSVTIEATPSVSSCEGNPVTFLAHPVNGGNSPSFQWFVNGVFSGNGSSYTSSSLPDNASVYCILTSNIPVCATGNPAQSNILITDIHP